MEILLELFLQLIVELLVELGVHGLRKPFKRAEPIHPAVAPVAYTLFGGFCGWLSLLVFPTLFIASHVWQLANLVITPVVAGGAMAAVGTWRRKRGEELIRLDRFMCGFLFALAMAVARYCMTPM